VSETAVIAKSPERTDADEPRFAYIARLATAYLVVSHDTNDRTEYAERLVEALLKDARVTKAIAPPLDKAWSPQFTVYAPLGKSTDLSGVLEATRHAHVQRFSAPLAFEVHVPAKNQPKVFDDDDIPTEDYLVLWDGAMLLVLWQQPVDDLLGSSGGHVVEHILEDATERIDAGILVQACSPECDYVFMHTAIRVVPEKGAADWSSSLDDQFVLNVAIPEPDPDDAPMDVALSVWYRTHSAVEAFAGMKNVGRQVLELEQLVRFDLDRLNRLHHERASASQQNVIQRTKALWTYRSWRRTSRLYLARLWLGLGNLERLKRRWTDKHLSFRRTADEAGMMDLFLIDSQEEMALVEELRLDLVEAAVQHASERLNSTAVAAATVGGAVAGALVAAVITMA
jgi:hypothetical protein